MNGEKRIGKKIIFGASVCSMFILCSFSNAIITSNNNDQLIVNPGGPYEGTVNDFITITIEIIGGVPPFNIFVNWSDGNIETENGKNVNIIRFDHKYSFPGIYNVTIRVTDAENNTDWCQTIVIISEIKCDLGIEIEVEKFQCTLNSGTWVIIRVIVHNNCKFSCDDYNVAVVINSRDNPGDIIIDDDDIQERLIGPGGEQRYTVEKYLSIDKYTVFATLSSDCGDDNEDNDVSHELTFYVLSNRLCEIIDKLPDQLVEFLEKFLDWIFVII